MSFYKACYEADSACRLRTSSDREPLDIQNRIKELLDNVMVSPITVRHEGVAEVITVQDIYELFLIPAYVPIPLYKDLSETLAEILKGNYTGIIAALRRDEQEPWDVCRSDTEPATSELYDWDLEAALTYICNDGEDLSSLSTLDLEKYILQLQNLSPSFGAYFAQLGFACSGWKIRPAWRFAGPYGRDVSGSLGPSLHEQQSLKRVTQPSRKEELFPLLFLSSRFDPVTPLRNAVAMSKLHPGSSVVIQESVGHCATHSSPSACTKGIVSSYFADGTMPENGTICQPDCKSAWDTKDECQGFRKGVAASMQLVL
jgi:hypothetical protein